MNKSDKLNAKFVIICVSNECPGTEEWTGLLRECPTEYLEGLHSHYCDHCGYKGCEHCDYMASETGEYTASIFEGTYRQLREALSDRSHSSHSLNENCQELCLGDFV